MSEMQDTPSKCPSADALSEFSDATGEEGGTVRMHVDTCSGCKSVVETYTKIDRATKNRMAPSDDLSERIKQVCRGTSPIHAPVMFTLWSKPIVRLAAAFAVTGALAVLAVMASRGSGNQIADSNGPVLAPDSGGVVVPVSPVVTGGVSGKGSVINASDVRTVDIRGGGSGNGTSLSSLQRLAVLPPNVKHVWTVADLADAEKRFLSLLPDGDAAFSKQLSSSRKAISVSLKDEQLQALVNRLSASDWDLVTSALPQPRKGAEVKFLGRAVRYDVEVVAK